MTHLELNEVNQHYYDLGNRQPPPPHHKKMAAAAAEPPKIANVIFISRLPEMLLSKV